MSQVNVKVNLPLKLVLVYMEHVLRILDRNIPTHLGAVQALGVVVLQHADDQLRALWDVHTVRSATRQIGRPCDLRANQPHPGGRRQLNPGTDYVALYEGATGHMLRREPSWAAARDLLYGQPVRQAARSAAVMAKWPSGAVSH